MHFGNPAPDGNDGSRLRADRSCARQMAQFLVAVRLGDPGATDGPGVQADSEPETAPAPRLQMISPQP
ncbi:MAG: hypothetical protein ACXWUX_08715 [Allosphingosinicella sp.]